MSVKVLVVRIVVRIKIWGLFRGLVLFREGDYGFFMVMVLFFFLSFIKK